MASSEGHPTERQNVNKLNDMVLLHVFSSLVVFYAIIFYLDSYLQVRNVKWYEKFRQWTNIRINFMNIRWTTTAFNRILTRFGQKRALLDAWFASGTVVALAVMIPSVVLLIRSAWTAAVSFRAPSTDDVVLQPVLPGVNLPKSEFLPYLITLAICTLFHEIGHALAAVREQIPLLSIGFLVFLVLPAAYVEIPTLAVTSLPAKQQLKIYCAGVWHNLVLSLFAYILLVALPILAFPLYRTGSGVSVTHVSHDLGPHYFQLGDHIKSVDGCTVTSSLDWRNCLIRALEQPPAGYCVNQNRLAELNTEKADCCEETSSSHLCFTSRSDRYCLRARAVVESSTGCAHCSETCLTPSLSTNTSRLMKIQREHHPDVLFLGEPGELYSTVHVDDYVPRWFLSAKCVRYVDNLLRYLVAFSAGLAVLNVVPCQAMDGQHIMAALADHFGGNGRHFVRHKILPCSIWFGTFLVVFNVAVGVISLFV